MILWVELPSEFLVAAEILDPTPAPLSLSRTLLDGFRNPQVGPPRRPRRIRVANEVDAAEVRAAVGRTIEVVVAPTPELHAVLDELAEDLAGEAEVVGRDEDASYLEDGRISSDVVARLFAAGQILYAAAPWKQADLRELNERNFSRFDAKLAQRIAESDARWERRLADLTNEIRDVQADLIRWMFIFVTGSTFTVLGVMVALLKL